MMPIARERRPQALNASVPTAWATPTGPWLDAAGTPIAVQQRLMRHADIRTRMNIYGDVVTDQTERALEKVARMAVGQPN